MSLLKSLICLKGHDNGRRFLVISIACYVLLVMLTPILSRANIILVLLFLSASPILLASSIRRIHDAGFATPLAGISVLVFWLNLFGLTYLEHGAKWALLFFALLVSVAMATISNAKVKRNHKYVLGYSGPVDLSESEIESFSKDRIEPTIAGASAHKEKVRSTEDMSARSSENSQDSYVARSIVPQQSIGQVTESSERHTTGWEQQLRVWFAANKKLSLIALALISAYIMMEVVLAILSGPAQVEKPEKAIELIEQVKQRIDKVEMPDSFWVMRDQYDSITIAWEGDFRSESDLEKKNIYWSAATAKGDKECTNLHFSLGDNIKTLLVTVKNGGDYYADFSPVDSELIIKSISDKDRFKLCGYEFTLKGTRSLLRDNRKYREYLMKN